MDFVAMKRSSVAYSLVLLGVTLFCSCSIGRFIPEDEILYTGAELKTTSDSKLKDFKNVENELNDLLQPEPNSKLLGMRLGLFYHYKVAEGSAGFVTKWLNKKFGEEPVYLSDVEVETTEKLIANRLENRGFFYNEVDSETKIFKNKGNVTYSAKIPEPYVLQNYSLEKDSLQVYETISETLESTLLKPGNRFDLNLMKAERERIDIYLKQKGYYNFSPDFLLFEADTNQYTTKKFDLFLKLKRNTPLKATVPYSIDEIAVFPNYAIRDSLDNKQSTVNGIDFFQDEIFFKPEKLAPYILLEEGQLYNANTARLTSNRLSSIGSYKYVNTQFSEQDTIIESSQTGSLKADIYLSPLNKRALRAEMQATTQSNGFAGPGIALTYTNRNLFKGGETLSLTGNFSYAAQLSSGKNSGLATIEAGMHADLIIPSLVPFSPKRFNYAVPKTKISLGGNLLRRSELYTLNGANTSFGYTWNANKYVYHELTPLGLNYVNLSRTTPEFEAILDQNPFLRNSFQQQFIAGLTYTFTYNEIGDASKKNPFYFSTNIDMAGNLLNLFSGGSQEVLGLEYAQYSKADVDFRFYFRWAKERTLVTRLFAGLGIPYGNSETLPFVKQYFSGGPYSVRAFRIRSLGPGTFSSTQGVGNSFFDQSGNLRLEGNLEYRFPLWSYLKGAFFADAGNVWLTKSIELDENASEESRIFNEDLSTQGKFGKDWANQLGIGVGFGLRLDIQSFVIRLDLATPVHIPYLQEGERWTLPFAKRVDDNFILNFAIGYPF